MKTIVATIKPHHLGNIRRGVKGYEMRKTAPKELSFRVLCCESGSGGQIKAEFTVKKVLRIAPDEFYKVLFATCVSKNEADEYAKGKQVCFWEISDMIDYCSTKGYRVRNIAEFGLKKAPQSWQYVESGDDL